MKNVVVAVVKPVGHYFILCSKFKKKKQNTNNTLSKSNYKSVVSFIIAHEIIAPKDYSRTRRGRQ